MTGEQVGEKTQTDPRRLGSILFVCSMNSIRSPMAEAIARSILPSGTYVISAGVRRGERDPFVDAVLAEIGLEISKSHPQALEDLEDEYFDLVITLSPEAQETATSLMRSAAVDIQYWPMPDPSQTTGRREQIMDAYRYVRDSLKALISEHLLPVADGHSGQD